MNVPGASCPWPVFAPSMDGSKEEPSRSALPAKKTADSDELEVMTKQEGLMRNGDLSHLFTVNAALRKDNESMNTFKLKI